MYRVMLGEEEMPISKLKQDSYIYKVTKKAIEYANKDKSV